MEKLSTVYQLERCQATEYCLNFHNILSEIICIINIIILLIPYPILLPIHMYTTAGLTVDRQGCRLHEYHPSPLQPSEFIFARDSNSCYVLIKSHSKD